MKFSVNWGKFKKNKNGLEAVNLYTRKTNESRLKLMGEHEEVKNERQCGTKTDKDEENKKRGNRVMRKTSHARNRMERSSKGKELCEEESEKK